MKKILRITFAVFLLVAGILLLSLSNQGIIDLNRPFASRIASRLAPQAPVVAFQNVALIPMDRERLLENQTVIVRDGQIDQLGDTSSVQVPEGALLVDGSGKYLMPGLVDMHVHVMSENELLLYAAHGVTALRNLWGGMNFTDHLDWRRKIELDEMFGPTLYTSGPIMEGPPKTMPLMPVYGDAVTAAAEVDAQIDQGYDFIKVYDYLDLPTYEAILAAARKRGVSVVGHVPKRAGLARAIAGGQATIEHISGFIDSDAGQYIVPESELADYARMAAQAGVWICPTIAVYQMHVPDEDLPLLEHRPEMALVSPGMKFIWQYLSRPGAMSNISYEGDYPARIREIFLSTTRLLHENGVRFILGTDSDNPYLVPGVSLLDELDYLVEAGFSPYEALQTGTRNAAEALGQLEAFGTIEAGKRADLILLDRNPLQDVSALRERSGVMLRGRWLPQAELQALLDGMVDSFRPNWLERLWPLGLVFAGAVLLRRRQD
jgi:imidazolonepropionase-like amidohydrolase